MRIIKGRQINHFIKKLKDRTSAHALDHEIEETVRSIVLDVKKRGDRALREYTRRFDRVEADLRISEQEIKKVASGLDDKAADAIKRASDRIREFHKRQIEKTWKITDSGITTGQIIRPLDRVGVYVPGGKAAYPSTVLMNVIPAQVAGVREIAVCVPTPSGIINPYVAYAIHLLGIKEVYRIGGAQAIAALAYGTESVKKVDKIVGPGNIYVAVAKKMVFGDVGIDMIAGPSEILIIADKTANPGWIAADLLSQAEHDEMASSVLITDSERLAKRVSEEVKSQMKTLKRKDIAGKSIKKYGAIIVVRDIMEGVDIANSIAPEHLEINTSNPSRILKKIKNAGAVFIGRWSTEPIGDYAAGPNHTLPTGGTARFSSPLGVYDFIKRMSYIRVSKRGFCRIGECVETIANIEGLEAHARTIGVRKRT